MTLPDASTETLYKTFRLLAKKHKFGYHHFQVFSIDSKEPDVDPNGKGISASYLWQIVHYRISAKPSFQTEMVMRNLLEKLRLRYPLDKPKTKQKTGVK